MWYRLSLALLLVRGTVGGNVRGPVPAGVVTESPAVTAARKPLAKRPGWKKPATAPAYYPGLDNVLKAGFDVSSSYAKANITVLHSGPTSVGSTEQAYPGGTSINVDQFNRTMICDFVIFTAHDKFTDAYVELDTWRASYAEFQSTPTCLFNINSEKVYPTPLTRPQNFDRHLERYRAALIINWLIGEGSIVTVDPQEKTAPWVMYLDSDIALTNKNLGIQAILDRVAEATTARTAEQRVCGPLSHNPGTPEAKDPAELPPFTCFPDRLTTPPPTLDEIGFMIAPEVNCFDPWGVNSGSWLYKPSRLSSAIFTSVLYGYRRRVRHKFYGMDQGYMNWALEELFNLQFGRLRNFCLPFREDYWTPGIEGNEILFSRSIQPLPATAVIREVLNFYYPNDNDLSGVASTVPGRQADGRPAEPKYAVYLHMRWINAPGCPWIMEHPQRSLLTWKPGDFAVHFNSCHAAGFHTPEFREVADKFARDLIPHPADYDWDARWMNETVPFLMKKAARMQLEDPPARYWEKPSVTPPAAVKAPNRRTTPHL